MAKLKRMRQRILWPGLAFTLVAISVLLAAINTGTNLLYLVAGGLISFLVLSLWLSRWSLRRLDVSREAPAAVYRGEEFAVGLRIENRKFFMPAVSLRIESTSRPGLSAGYVLKVPARRAALSRMLELLDRRGVHPLPNLRISTAFPFGLVEARRVLRDAPDVLVYPRVHAVSNAAVEQVLGAGNVPKTTAADGDEFFSLREYVRGDDTRRIAWRASARSRSLLVKEMEADAARTITLYLDTTRSEDPDFAERFEAAIEALASLAVALLKRRFSVGLATPTRYIPEAEGTGQIRRILEALARVEPTDSSVGLTAQGPAGRRLTGAAAAFSGNPAEWGRWNRLVGARIFDPREIIRG